MKNGRIKQIEWNTSTIAVLCILLIYNFVDITSHVSLFTDELFAAVVTSTRSHAKILSIDQSEALKLDGVVDFICKDDVPGKNDYGVIIHDDQLFADGEVL